MAAGAVSLKPESHVIGAICKQLLAYDGSLMEAAQNAPYSGLGVRAVEILKEAVAAGSTLGGDWSAIAPYKFAANAFLESLQNQSAYAALAPNFLPLPLRSNVVITSTTATASIVDEGKPKPLTRLELSADNVDAVKALAIVVVSSEVAKFGGALAEKLIRSELRNAVSLAVDLKFFDILTATGAGWVYTFAATGDTQAALAADVRTAFEHIDIDASSRLHWVTSPEVAAALATLSEGGQWVNTELGPQGGQFINIPLTVSDAVLDDQMWLIDASKIGGSFENLAFTAAREGDVQMVDTPDDPTTQTTVTVSLWQHNLVALRAEAYFGAKPLRGNFAVKITSVDYGAA